MPDQNLYRLATCSGWLRDEIWREGHKLPKIDVVYPAGKVHHYYRESLSDLESSPFHISFAGIVQPYKGPHILLEALFLLHKWGIPFTASIAGTTTDEGFYTQLKNAVANNGLSDAIDFTGFLDRNKLKELFWKSTVYVQPSVFPEPFGISHVEAMASGATVVTSGTGGSKEIIIDGESGLHFRTEDSTHLAEQLKYLYENQSKCDELRSAGQVRAMELFDNEKSVDRLEEIFAELLMKNRSV
jgi:glycosyltransferase involved in cell wall biosynthesis